MPKSHRKYIPMLLRHQRGFTLVEVITVLVVVSIVAGIGTKFVVTTMHSYRDVEQRAKLIAKGRVVIEQMTRQFRGGLPNSFRVSGSGNCIEFMPIVAGANYADKLPDTENGAPVVTSISTSPFTLGLGTAEHAVVAGYSATTIYTTSNTAARVSINALAGASPYTSLSLSSVGHRFVNNSVNQRVFIAADPKRFCLSGANLVEYSGYGLNTTAMNDSQPAGASTAIMGNTITTNSTAFALSVGSEDRNTAVLISLEFMQGENTIELNHQALIRNVP